MPFPVLPGSLSRALQERGYGEPTPVQAAVLEADAADRDLLVSAQTGSGKTVAYGLAIGATLLGDKERFGPAGAPLALAIAPTRELALQVQRELEWLYGPSGARVVSCVGGMDVRREQKLLAQGAHIVVGTPGRLRDHVERSHLDLSTLKAAVLDEADEMLDLGFREDLEAILDTTAPERRTLLFSATLPKAILTLARRYQKDAVRIAMAGQDQPHGDIEYRAMSIAPHETDRAVVNVLRYFEARAALVFCSTRAAVQRLQGNLLERGFAVVALSGELGQAERNRALQALRDGRARVCVATDVAARGLDLPDLGLVIHADLPMDEQTLQHRSGRTGRAGRKGVCVVLAPYNRRRQAERLLAGARVEVAWTPAPSAAEIRLRDRERLIADTSAAEDGAEEDLADARALLAERSAEDLAAALVRFHRRMLPSPEDLAEPDRRISGDRAVRERKPYEGKNPDGRSFEGSSERGGFSRRDEPADHESVWFSMNVGRKQNADPKWLVPFLCRRGHITRNDIGRIEVGDRNTRFAISEAVAARFATAAKKPDSQDKDILIEHATAPDRDAPRPKRSPGGYQGRTERGGKPRGGEGGGDKGGPPKRPFKARAR